MTDDTQRSSHPSESDAPGENPPQGAKGVRSSGRRSGNRFGRRRRAHDHQEGFKATVWRVLNDPSYAPSRWFAGFITALILLSFGMLVYEVIVLTGQPTPAWMRVVDYIILSIFGVEFAARLWVIRGWRPRSIKLTYRETVKYWVRSRIKFILSPWGLVDLIALLPIIPFLRSLRILRVLRLFRFIKIFRYAKPFETLSVAVRNNSLLFAVATSFVAVAIGLSAVMLFLAEYGINEHIQGLDDTLWWAIVTISTVGFGDITPQTGGGRLIGAILMLTGMFVIALFAGVTSSTLVGHLLPLRTEQVRMSSVTDHIVIAGWNDDVPMLIQQMEGEHGRRPPSIMVMAPRPRPESLDQKYTFVEADFDKEAEFEKVRLQWARTVIVVADQSGGVAKSQARDATTVLTVFTVRSLEKKFEVDRDVPLHVCAEILDPENLDHAVTAGADEIIPSALLGYSVIARSATNPGVGIALSELVLASGQNLYTSPLPVELIEGELLEFHELRQRLRDEYDVLLVGSVHRGKLVMNPDPDTDIYANDQIVYIGESSLEA